jgi:ubiquinone/menaquinone biosynthesis C-methylase UbiE
MRRDWDERARKNAFHYVASWREEWDLDSFLASGEDDVSHLVLPALARCGLPATGERMLELGCGAGRMTHSFARRFAHVYAFDLSPEMLARAQRIHGEQKNILWLLSSGSDLSCVASDSMDFVFSYLVLQHLPKETLVFQYIREMLRVLRPGGAILFQFNGSLASTMNWRGRLAWGIVDAFWSARLRGASRAAAVVFGLDPAVAGKSWRGASIAAACIAEFVPSSGGEVRELAGENTPMTWCCGVKSEKRAQAGC